MESTTIAKQLLDICSIMADSICELNRRVAYLERTIDDQMQRSVVAAKEQAEHDADIM